MSAAIMELLQRPGSLALNQLSEDDRKLVARLKQTYPSHILDAVFQQGLLSSDRQQQWSATASSPRDSTASSTLYMTSVDGDTCCSSRESRSSTTSFGEKGSLWKKRAASLPRNSSKSSSRPQSRRGDLEHREIRITLKPRPAQVAPLAAIDAALSPCPSPTPPALPPAEIKTLYFCTQCEESFQERFDWRQHEYLIHERQYYWPCPKDGCDQIFTEEPLFIQHHQGAHGCKTCPHAPENQRPLPSKRAWGCGFDRCKGVFDNWDARCDHVASHFEDLAKMDDATQQPSEWRYTNMLRNLLRQPDMKEAFKRTLIKCHGDDKVFWPKMKWRVETSRELLRKLEYRDFRGGLQDLATIACQLGLPASAEPITIAINHVEEIARPEPSPIPVQNMGYLHIDKFPQPGTNPFDLYGPVPPSPIIQLDFVADPTGPDPQVEVLHSTKPSLAQKPYSLYPSPTITEQESQPGTSSKPSSPLANSPTSDSHSVISPTDSFSFQTPATWATAYSGADGSPPRPKTPLSMLKSAKSLLKKRSAPRIPLPQNMDTFDRDAAQQAIAFYHAR